MAQWSFFPIGKAGKTKKSTIGSAWLSICTCFPLLARSSSTSHQRWPKICQNDAILLDPCDHHLFWQKTDNHLALKVFPFHSVQPRQVRSITIRKMREMVFFLRNKFLIKVTQWSFFRIGKAGRQKIHKILQLTQQDRPLALLPPLTQSSTSHQQ